MQKLFILKYAIVQILSRKFYCICYVTISTNLRYRHLDSLPAMSSKITIAEADEAAADSGSSGPEPEILVSCCMTTTQHLK